jgi:branched-chain amino acid transport system ATP-binding protein
LLDAKGVSVRFGGHAVVIDVSLHVAPAFVTGLIGPNGAGKTTLFNVISGLQPATNGEVVLDGHDITGLPPHRRAHLGLARTFQRLELFGSLTVRENLQVAAEYRNRRSPDALDVDQQVDEAIDFVGLTEVSDTRADELSTGRARLVELGRALVTRPKVLLLDEPASGLDGSETDEFAEIIGSLAESGMSVLLVEHDVPLVMRACSTIYVLDFGKIIASGSPQEIQSNATVLDAYLGTRSTS